MALDDVFKGPFEDSLKEFRTGQTLLEAPMAEHLKSLGFAVAEAQVELDKNSIKSSLLLGSNTVELRDRTGTTVERSLLELGFTPTFYHFSESVLTTSVTLSFKVENSMGIKFGLNPGKSKDSDSSTSSTASKASTVQIKVTGDVPASATIKIGDTTLAFTKVAPALSISLTDKVETTAAAIIAAIKKAFPDGKVTATGEGAKVTVSKTDGTTPKVTTNNTTSLVISGAEITVAAVVKEQDKLTVEDKEFVFVTPLAANTIPIATNKNDQARVIAETISKVESVSKKVTASAKEDTVTLSAASGAGETKVTVTGAGLSPTGDTVGKAASPSTPGGSSPGNSAPSSESDKTESGAGDVLQNVGKGLAAIGLSFNLEYNRKYGFDASATTRIESKLVSLPPPAPFLEHLKNHFSL